MAFDRNQPFTVPDLPPKIDFRHERFIDLLLKARTELGELNGYSFSLPNPLLLLSPAAIKESVASSEIENINTTMEEALQAQLFPEREVKQPDKEVLRYRDATMWGFENLKNVPISHRLITGIHKKLLPGKTPGLRRIQNRVTSSTTLQTIYTPPPANEVSRLLGNWEKFVNNEADGIDPLLKCALAHYQFEAIHPFGDGNGRTGRILIVLFLVQARLLSLPILYVSGYINDNRNEYYRLLRQVTEKSEWIDWIVFMLKGLHLQARKTKEVLLSITSLLVEMKDHIRAHHKKIYSSDLVEVLFAYPIITPVNLARKLGISYRTASRYLTALLGARLLKESHVGKYHLYANVKLLKLLRESF